MLYETIVGRQKFAAGSMKYLDQYPGEENAARIVLQVQFAHVKTLAVVDTGSPYCILDPNEGEELTDEFDNLGPKRISLRGSLVLGKLFRLPITLNSNYGDSLTIDSVVFIPELKPNGTWHAPNFVGMDGFLQSLRFAVDPHHNYFYFSELREVD